MSEDQGLKLFIKVLMGFRGCSQGFDWGFGFGASAASRLLQCDILLNTDSSTGVAAKQSQELQEVPAWPVPSPRRRLPIVSAALPFQLPQNGCQRFAASAWRSNVDRKHVRGSKSLHSAGSLQLHSEATKHGSTMFHQRPLPNEAASSKRSMSTFAESMQYSRKYHGPCCGFHAVYLGAAWPAGYASLLTRWKRQQEDNLIRSCEETSSKLQPQRPYNIGALVTRIGLVRNPPKQYFFRHLLSAKQTFKTNHRLPAGWSPELPGMLWNSQRSP